ncbi:MAG: hypothetical protein LUB56_00710 [Coprobacillus sp.]|nr:hypothetical protein [Coprobacillus sp.]
MEEITSFFADYWYILLGAGILVIIAAIAIVLGLTRHRAKQSSVAISESDYILNFVEGLGGAENIASVAIDGKKLVVGLVNFQIYDKSLLAALGVTKTSLDKHMLTITMERDPKKIADLLSPYIQGELN